MKGVAVPGRVRIPLLIAALAVSTAAQAADPAGPAPTQTPPPVNVAVAQVTQGPIRSWVSAEGTARAVRRELLSFGRSGKVMEIGVDSKGEPLREGSFVLGPRVGKPGQVIARLDARDQSEKVSAQTSQAQAAQQRVESARSAVNQQRAELDQATKNLSRITDLVAKGWAPRKQLDEAQGTRSQATAKLERARADLAVAEAEAKAARSEATQVQIRGEEYEIRAPFDGIVAFMNIAVGDYASPLPTNETDMGRLLRMAAAVVIDHSVYEIVVEIPSFQSLSIGRGMEAQVTWGGMNLFDVADDPSKTPPGAAAGLPMAKAQVYAVAPAIAPDSRTVRVRLRTVADADRLLEGLYVSVRILAAERTDVIQTRLEAARYEKGRAHVFVVDPKTGIAHRREVRLGLSEGQKVEVVEGLRPDETVVVAGQERLVDGAPVRIVDGGPSS